MPYTQEQLEAMPTEKLLELKQQLMTQSKTATPRPSAAGMLVGGLAGGLRGLAGKPPEAPSEVGTLEKMTYANMLKGAAPVDPIKEVKLEMEKTKLEGLKQKQEVAEQKQVEKEEKAEMATDLIRSSAQDMLNTIQSVKEGSKYFGPYGNVPSIVTSIGGVVDYKDRKKWENNVNRLLAKKGLDMMVELKNASRTGATGFGQLSEKEGQWLRDASTALTRDLSSKDATAILNEMERLYGKVLLEDGSAPAGQGPAQDNDMSQMSDEELQAIIRGQ